MNDHLVAVALRGGVSNALQLEVLSRLMLAAALGAVVGLEREISGKPAGLRTNLLICLGAALLTELSISVADAANQRAALVGSPFLADPGRIAAQIVSGIGFIGAGTILQSRGHVMGLTTAATIWVVAAIGMAVGSEAYVMAIGTTALVTLTLAVLGRVEGEVFRRKQRQKYLVRLDPEPHLLEEVEAAIRETGLRVGLETVERGDTSFDVYFDVTGRAELHRRLLLDLIARPGVRRITRVS